ncbi:sigma-70 family RNA polymerase sigma factor [Candidatus Hydrogenedentota bacterium]
MSKFNPDFWEVVVEREQLESYALEDSLWHDYNKSGATRERRKKRTRETFRQVNELIRTELTARQREVVRLYYFKKLTQEEISRLLDIPQQVVSQHLFGILRNGKRTGGAIPRLRKLCEQRGVEW